MVFFSGLSLKEKEKTEIEKEINKINKFYRETPDVSIRFNKINNNFIEITLITTYCNHYICITESGDNKIHLARHAVDGTIRKIRKIKTNMINKPRQNGRGSDLNNNDSESEKRKTKFPNSVEYIDAYNVDFPVAVDLMEGEGLDIVVFYNSDNNLNVLVKTEDGYKLYSIK